MVDRAPLLAVFLLIAIVLAPVTIAPGQTETVVCTIDPNQPSEEGTSNRTVCESGPDHKIRIVWEEIEKGSHLFWCFTPGNSSDELDSRPDCKQRNIHKDGGKTATSSGMAKVPFPGFLFEATEESSRNASKLPQACHDSTCHPVSLFLQAQGPSGPSTSTWFYATPTSDSGGLLGGLLDSFSGRTAWIFVGGTSVLLLAFSIGWVTVRKSNGTPAQPGKRGANRTSKREKSAPKQNMAPVTAKRRPIGLVVKDAERGTRLTDGVRIHVPKDKTVKRRQDRWEIPSPGAHGYEVRVEAPNYHSKTITITNRTTFDKRLAVELAPLEGSVDLSIEETTEGQVLGGLSYAVIPTGKRTSKSTDTTIWGEPSRIDGLPFGTYQVVVRIPPLFRLDPDETDVKTEGRRIAREIEVPPDGVEEVHLRLRVDLPKIPLSNNLQRKLRETMESVQTYDTFIPQYLSSIVTSFGEFVTGGLNTELRGLVQQGLDEEELVHAVQEAQQQMGDELVESMTSRSNLSLFASTQEGEAPPQPRPTGVASTQLLLFPEERDDAVEELQSRVRSVDERLTELSSEITIRPLADLLSLARALLEEGASDRQPVRGAAKILAGDLCLGSLEQAIQDDRFRPHLAEGGL